MVACPCIDGDGGAARGWDDASLNAIRARDGDRVSNGDRPKTRAVDGRNLAASIDDCDRLLKGLARRAECARVAVIAVGGNEDAGTGIGWRNCERAGERSSKHGQWYSGMHGIPR